MVGTNGPGQVQFCKFLPRGWPLGTLIAVSAVFPSLGWAQVECKPTAGPRPGLQCVNRYEDSGTIITTRHMPAWGPNAGMMLIDMCRVPMSLLPTGAAEVPSVRSLTEEERAQVSEELPDQCIRRFCTDKVKEFSIMINATPIPIGGAFLLGVQIGFKSSKFTVECENFVPPTPNSNPAPSPSSHEFGEEMLSNERSAL